MPFAYTECNFAADFRHGEHIAPQYVQQPLQLRVICAEQLLRIVLPAERIAGERSVLEPAIHARAERVEQRKLRVPVRYVPLDAAFWHQFVIQRRQCRHIAEVSRRGASLSPAVRVISRREIWKNGS